MKKKISSLSLALLLAIFSCLSNFSIFSNTVYAESLNPIDTIEGLIPGIDEEDISVDQHPAEQITEKTIEGVWEVVNSKVSITFNTGRPASVLTSIQGVLEKVYDIIADACNTASIESRGHQEYLSYIPPNFNDDKFDIIAYDPYATSGRFTGDLNSSSDEIIFRVKVYPEFSANDPIEYTLKNLQKLNLPINATTQNLILEFYAGDEQAPFDKIYLPADKNNKKFGICLTKTKSNNFVYYLTKETRHHISNTFMVTEIMVPLYGDNVIFKANLESVWNNMDWHEKEVYGPLIWKNADEISKSDISQSSYNPDYILSLWQDPKHFVRGNTMIIYGNNYHSNYSENTQKILVDEQGQEKPNLGLTFNENGKASYEIYIPKTGTYDLQYIFTHDEAVNFTVKNLLDGAIVYSMEASSPDDGQTHVKVSVPREIELNEGLIYIEVEGSSFDLNAMILDYIGNKEEDRANYLQKQYDFIRLEAINAIDRLDRNNGTKEEIENALNSAKFIREQSILPKKQNLLDGGYTTDEPLMKEIDKHIEALDNRIGQAESELASYPDTYEILIQAEEPYDSVQNITINEQMGLLESTGSGSARYKVTIPKAGHYKLQYFVSSFNNSSAINVLDENGRTFDNVHIPKTNDSIMSLKFTSVDGSREYFEAGETYISIYTSGAFMLDKIIVNYDEVEDIIIEAENPAVSVGNIQLNETYAEFSTLPERGCASYLVTIPKDGYYNVQYAVSTDNVSSIRVDNGFIGTIDNMEFQNTNNEFISVEGSKYFFTTGENVIYIYCMEGTLKVDKIILNYTE